MACWGLIIVVLMVDYLDVTISNCLIDIVDSHDEKNYDSYTANFMYAVVNVSEAIYELT